MPLGEDWWNPYRHLPAWGVPPERRAPRTHERFAGLRGRLECRLENLTLLFVGGVRTPHEFERRPLVPGTSLKGMLRSLAEIAGNGCAIVGTGGACAPPELCIACRLFGSLRGSAVHLGQVAASDGVLEADAGPQTRDVEVLLSTPRPQHGSFYAAGGRKMYFHRPRNPEGVMPIPAGIPKNAAARRRVRALLPGHCFRFAVSFWNLEEDELALLLYCLALEEDVAVRIQGEGPTPPKGNVRLRGPLRHKLGLGKPVGMGSVEIKVEALELELDPAARYRRVRAGGAQVLRGEELRQAVSARTAPHRQEASAVMQALRKMMVWDPSDPRELRYPEYSWFQANPLRGLKPL